MLMLIIEWSLCADGQPGSALADVVQISGQGTVLYTTFTCAPAMLEAGIVFGGVCLSVCPHKVLQITDLKLM